MIEATNRIADWIGAHYWIVWLSFGFSLATIFATLVLVPFYVVRMPSDYFVHSKAKPSPWRRFHPMLRAIGIVAKNFIGVVMLAAGLIMLFVPGPGTVAILGGLALLDLPGKHALERWIACRPRVFIALNKLRVKRGQPPFEPPA